jgi:hypothetical protein
MTELLGLAASHPAWYAGLLLAATVSGVLRRWIAHRTAVRHEIETTQRLELAIRDTESQERAAIVRAYAQLAASSPKASER